MSAYLEMESVLVSNATMCDIHLHQNYTEL